jgi:hypothetical protein
MAKHSVQLQRLMFLFAIAGLFAVTADFACLEDVCAEMHTGAYHTMNDIMKDRVLTLKDALDKSGVSLTAAQQAALVRDGQLLGVLKLTQPVKHPNGTVEMPAGWLPAIPEGHPWSRVLTPSDDAYYSFVEERIFKARLFDPANAEHQQAAAAYLAKRSSDVPDYVGWTYESRTECEKKKLDSGSSK